MKAIKTFTSLLLVLVIVCSFVTMSAGALASNTNTEAFEFKDNSNFLQFFRPTEDGMMVFCATMDNFPDVSAFQAMLAGQPTKILGMDSARDEPVTYYCLVDVSGSISYQQLLMAEEMLKALCDSLGRDDQMLIDTFAQEHRRTDYLRDRSRIYHAIEEIILTTEDTNLYRGIADSLQELNTNLDLVGQRKCLVVFSDGVDDITADVGRTRQEAEDMVDSTRIPVYCMVPPYGAQDDGKVLGSICRRSVGGEAYYMTDNSDLTEQKIGRAITNDMKGDRILRLDLTGFKPKDDEFLLAVQYTNRFGSVFGDSLTIISKLLKLKTVVVTKTSSSPTTTFENPISREKDYRPLWIKIGLGAVCLIALVLIVLLLMKRKKDEERLKQDENEERQRRDLDARFNKIANAGGGAAGYQAPQNNWAPDNTAFAFGGAAAAAAAPVRGGRKIRFVAVGNQSFTKEISVQEGKQTTVGRNKKADVILNESDNRLSGVHFILQLKDNQLTVRDAGSTNGTMVNGVKVRDNMVPVRNGDTVSVGSYQYRVQY